MARLNKSLVFKRAWATYKLKLKHNCEASFAYELSNCYKIARLIGYANYKPSVSEDTHKSSKMKKIEQAKQMEESKAITLQNESESKAIPELSDEEIEKEGEKYINIFITRCDAFIEGAKWYREQLKQRQ